MNSDNLIAEWDVYHLSHVCVYCTSMISSGQCRLDVRIWFNSAHNVPCLIFTGRLSRKVLLALSWKIPTEWHELGILLDLEFDSLDNIRDDNRFPSPKQKALEMLKSWSQRNVENAVQVLAEALMNVERGDLAEWVLNQVWRQRTVVFPVGRGRGVESHM